MRLWTEAVIFLYPAQVAHHISSGLKAAKDPDGNVMKFLSLIVAASLVVFGAALMAIKWSISPTGAFALVLGVVILIWRPGRPPADSKLPVGTEMIFDGRYVAHWEVARFDWFKDGKPWQGWNTQYMCQLRFPDRDGWHWLDEAIDRAGGNLGRGPGLRFKMQFHGRIAEVGHFGHLGMCSYVIDVLEMIHLEQIEGDPQF